MAAACLNMFACKEQAPSGLSPLQTLGDPFEGTNLELESEIQGFAFAFDAELIIPQDAPRDARVLRLVPFVGSGKLSPLGEKYSGISRVSYLIHDDLTLVAERDGGQDPLLAETTLFVPGTYHVIGIAYGLDDVIARSELTLSWNAQSQRQHVFSIRPASLTLRVGEEFIASAFCPDSNMTPRWYLATERLEAGENLRVTLSNPGFLQVSARCQNKDPSDLEPSDPFTASIALFVHP
jgi:hypothetical protein